MWSRKGLTPEQALSYLDELEGLSESNSEHEGESTSDSENEVYSRVLRKSGESNSTSEIQATDTTLENSLSVASYSYKTSDTKKKGFLLEKNQSKDGTKWKVVSANEIRAVKTAQRNILKDNPGPTFYAKQKTNKEKISTFWRLFVDNHMLKIIKNCTETEANNKLKNVDWKLSFEDLNAFIAVLYAREANASSKLELECLWSTKWGPPFFRETMSKNRFKEIMKFLRFDIRTTRRERLQHDKFALVSDI
ncbi:hypothetical protein ILUMI_27259 [Ignelater luminosus]|uniref:PiggyBac transposable element-derived protein domain-containing protein n=1 Tax=Ignelater luminosus TaxID=2038154 RepID=A0A8K0C4R8_IGNLU|nr:hypothetical protein ILUMI_27259 [Ignelater luminosus]